MINDAIQSIASAVRKLFTNFGAVLISYALYALFVSAVALFFTTREATTAEVVASLVLPLLAMLFFFTWQAMGVSYVRIGVGPGYLLKRALRDSGRLFLISLPLLVLGVAVYWLLPARDPAWLARRLHQDFTGVNAVWYLIFGFVLPLAAIHFWIAAAREGLAASGKGIGRNFLRALSPRSALIYLPVVAVFGGLAYYLFATRTSARSEWADVALFGARLVLALTAIFAGWMITLGAMAEMTARRALAQAAEPSRPEKN
jgi:hypothetical protein